MHGLDIVIKAAQVLHTSGVTSGEASLIKLVLDTHATNIWNIIQSVSGAYK